MQDVFSHSWHALNNICMKFLYCVHVGFKCSSFFFFFNKFKFKTLFAKFVYYKYIQIVDLAKTILFCMICNIFCTKYALCRPRTGRPSTTFMSGSVKRIRSLESL